MFIFKGVEEQVLFKLIFVAHACMYHSLLKAYFYLFAFVVF